MPTQDFKIALIPLEIAPFDTERNLELALKRIDRLDSDTSLCVLPEMFNSGFALNKELPSYSQITLCEIRKEPFEKTPKLSIKRFMYK